MRNGQQRSNAKPVDVVLAKKRIAEVMEGKSLAEVYARQIPAILRNSFMLHSTLERLLEKDYKLVAEDTVRKEMTDAQTKQA